MILYLSCYQYFLWFYEIAQGIGDDGIKALAEALKINTKAKVVDVSGTGTLENGRFKTTAANFGEVGATALSEMLKINSTITELRAN